MKVRMKVKSDGLVLTTFTNRKGDKTPLAQRVTALPSESFGRRELTAVMSELTSESTKSFIRRAVKDGSTSIYRELSEGGDAS